MTLLAPEQLYTACDPDQLPFETTAELDEVPEMLGQERAVDAVRFGIGIRREGYNLFVMGPAGMGKHALVEDLLGTRSRERPTPDDWCYVHSFDSVHQPRAIRLPPGWGARLRSDLTRAIAELAVTIPTAFQGDEYRSRAQAIEEAEKQREERIFQALDQKASEEGIKLFRTPSGFAFAPLRDGEALSPSEYEALPASERARLEGIVEKLQEELRERLEEIPQMRRESREAMKGLNRRTARTVVDVPFADLKRTYGAFPAILGYLEEVHDDILENVDDFLPQEDKEKENTVAPTEMHRYKVNLLVDNSQSRGAPVVYLDHPTFLNLLGRAEHISQMGTLITDFTLLRGGALHRANGGYLLLDAHKLFTQPFAWEGLKRALFAHEVRIESLDKMLSLVSTVALEPEPIPLDLKVVLIGERFIYYMLQDLDPEFPELFKVAADFEERIVRTQESSLLYARLIATLTRKEGLKAFDKRAVARVIEHGARMVEDRDRLTTHMRTIADLLRESDYWAGEAGRALVLAQDVERALEQQVYRASRIRERLQEETERGVLLIDTDGAEIGQVNGLSVMDLGEYAFGHPTRITATAHIGDGNVVDIEREVELGGALHSKGVLILSGLLASRYAKRHPLSLSAHLVFEQSYGGVDGDSASLAELCALLSAIAETPLSQSLALTGSINQKGQVQAIGGVNEKVEGFFDLCAARGLTGRQGVLIPAANAPHLMLKEPVVEAVRNGRFSIHAVNHVDEALALLTGIDPGTADEDGNYPTESFNGRVQIRLLEMSLIKQTFGDRDHGRDEEEPAHNK